VDAHHTRYGHARLLPRAGRVPHRHPRGEAIQIDPIEPRLKAPETKLLNLKYGLLLSICSNFAFNFNLGRYIEGEPTPDTICYQAGAPRSHTSHLNLSRFVTDTLKPPKVPHKTCSRSAGVWRSVRPWHPAESPDEMAFVVAAKRFGYFFKRRTASGVDVVEPVFPSAGAGRGVIDYIPPIHPLYNPYTPPIYPLYTPYAPPIHPL